MEVEVEGTMVSRVSLPSSYNIVSHITLLENCEDQLHCIDGLINNNSNTVVVYEC